MASLTAKPRWLSLPSRRTGIALQMQATFRRGLRVRTNQLGQLYSCEFSPADIRLDELLEVCPDAILVVQRDGCLVLANRQVETLFGYSRAELFGKPMELLMPERLRAQHSVARSHYSRDPVTRQMGAGREVVALRKDGSEFLADVRISALATQRGQLLVAVVRDTTEHGDVERMFRQLLEAAPDAMVVVDSHGTIVLVNAQTEAAFGYARAELIGEGVEILVPPPYRAIHRSHRAGVTLPIDTSKEAPGYTLALPALRPSRRARIAVIDDDLAVCVLIKRLLQHEHDVLTFADARAALALFEQDRSFDLVFCDLMMPIVSGWDFYEKLCTAAPELAERTVFLTGGAFTEQGRLFLDRVPNLSLAKPVEAAALRSLINERLNQPATVIDTR